MRFHTYTKFSPEMADAVDLQSLLDKLADFLLQSGFAGGKHNHPYWGEFGGDEDRSMDALKEAILNALIESGQFTPEMLEALRGDGDEEAQARLAKMLDDLVQRLIEEGYLNVDAPPQMPAGQQPVTGPGGLAHAGHQHRGQGRRVDPRVDGAVAGGRGFRWFDHLSLRDIDLSLGTELGRTPDHGHARQHPALVPMVSLRNMTRAPTASQAAARRRCGSARPRSGWWRTAIRPSSSTSRCSQPWSNRPRTASSFDRSSA